MHYAGFTSSTFPKRTRKTKPQRYAAILPDIRNTALAACRLIPGANNKKLAGSGSLPVPEPFRVRGVAVCLDLKLGAEEFAGPEAQPYPA